MAEKDPTDTPEPDQPAAEEPAVEQTAVEETAAEEPAVEEPAAEETPAEEPAVEETAVEETAVEETAAEEPAPEEPAAEEPAAEEPAAEEPAAEGAPAAASKESRQTDPGSRPTPPSAASRPTPSDFGLDPLSALPVVVALIVILFAGWNWITGGEEEEKEEPRTEESAAPAATGESAPASEAPAPPESAAPADAAEVPPPDAPPTEAAAAPGGAVPTHGGAAGIDLSSITPYAGALLRTPTKPVDPDAEKLARSAVKAFEGGRYPEAHTQVDQAIAKSPGSARYESLRARILHAQGDHEGALEQLNAAVQHAPKDPEIYRQRASVNVALGRSAQARRDMAASSRLADGTSPSSPP